MPRAPVERLGAGLGSEWKTVATGNQLEGVAPDGCPLAPAEVWPFQRPGLPVPFSGRAAAGRTEESDHTRALRSGTSLRWPGPGEAGRGWAFPAPHCAHQASRP